MNRYVTVDYAKIFIGNVDYSLTEKELEAQFSQFGEVSDVHIHKDRYTGRSRGSAIVEFEKRESVDLALNFTDSLYLKNRKLALQEYKKF